MGCAGTGQLLVLTVPVTDLRREPQSHAKPGVHDPFEETQLLYGERVELVKKRDGWAYVKAIEQPEFTHTRRWQGYPGWVPEEVLAPAPTERLSDPNIVVTAKWAPVWHNAHRTTPLPFQLPLGTFLKGIDIVGEFWKVEMLDGASGWIAYEDAQPLWILEEVSDAKKRQLIVRAASQFLGDPYYWGGRSPFWDETPQGDASLSHTGSDPALGTITGVDCSGLVNIAYRAVGMRIPRDAHEQFMRAEAVTALKSADLIFLSAAQNPSKIVHVMLYVGDGEIIEGPGTGLSVRRIALSERLDRSVDQLSPGATVNEQTVFFGTYLP